ncbi:disease resistance protein RPV1 [Gossypium hirsutum]|uniref:Disease resistance protein RPV1 n=1 Tax=Gossypium hirsutum TaxID=3635 RepID=A0A1U8HVT9_GOSHI|nr:disease resistance protein RPV1-like [Gossypium hirsutum]
MAASSSSSSLMKYHVFLSFRGEDTRLNFTSHLLQALKSKGLQIFFDEEKLEKGEQLSQALSRAIAVSNISIIVLSADYASSKSCLVELSDIMIRKSSQGHIVLPIFYHVDPSNVRNIGGSFETSFEEHESKQPTDSIQRWKSAFAEVGKLKGPETEYIKDVVEYVIKELRNMKFRSGSRELVGIEYQKNTILKLIKQNDCRVLGLWGMGGQGKTTLADAVYKKISSEFENVDIGTPSIGSTLTQEMLNNKKLLVVLDDVDDIDQIDYMGVEYFGSQCKIIITSRDRQVLESGGADTIHEVKGLNENNSLQLFSTFAFKQLNPAIGFQDLSRRFVKYTQGNPLALKVLGEPIKRTKHILSGCYKGVECGINKLVDKCLINLSSSVDYSGYVTMRRKRYPEIISMHDMLEGMGKDIVRKESKTLGKCSRLWNHRHVEQVFKYNKGTDRIQGIKLDMSHMDNLLFQPFVFENMINLRYIFFYFPSSLLHMERSYYKKLLTYQVDIVSLHDELRYHRWDYYPFKSLPSSFNPKNLVVLKLAYGNMEQLWNESHQDLVHLRKMNLFSCKNLKKIPNLLGVVNLERLDCENCESLVELPSLHHLTSLQALHLKGCRSLKKFPEIPNNFSWLDLSKTGIEEVPDLIGHLLRLEWLRLRNSRVKYVSSISKLESIYFLDLSGCPILKLLSELPPYLQGLSVHDCTSLVKVSFADQNLYKFDSLDDDDVICMLFCNCFNLNQESTNNIEANAMLKIGSLAKKWAARYDWEYQREDFPRLICCFPGNKISADKFKCQSMNSSLSLKIAQNRGSGSRVLVFAICLVADLTHCHRFKYLHCYCEYQLTASDCGKEKFKSIIPFLDDSASKKCMGDHVFILSSKKMVKRDKNYEEASFEFAIIDFDYEKLESIEVERSGVHVFYVDAESDTDTTEMDQKKL